MRPVSGVYTKYAGKDIKIFKIAPVQGDPKKNIPSDWTILDED